MIALGRVSLAMLLLGFASPVGAADPVKISSASSAKGVSKVVIGAFNVGFMFESVDNTAVQGGLIGAFSGPTTAKSMLTGVSPAMMQAITDAAYADFKAQLVARGFTVATPDALFSGARMAKVKPIPSPYQVSVEMGKDSRGKTYFYKPSALPMQVMLAGDFSFDDSQIQGAAAGAGMAGQLTGIKGLGMLGGLGGLARMGRGMSGMDTQMAMLMHARETGEAVIDVVYLLDFSDAKRNGFFSLGGMTVNSGMSIVGDYSKLRLVSGDGTAGIVLKQPVGVEGDFATKADTTGGFNKVAGTAVNVVGAFAGVSGGKTRRYTFTVKPDAYQQGAIKATTLANARLAESLSGLR